MIKDLPRRYKRINVYNKHYQILKELKDSYIQKQIKDSDTMQQVFDQIKFLYVFYHKSMRDLLKEKDIILYLPSQIFIKAQELNFISDAATWLEYISDLNSVIQSPNPQIAEKKRYYMVEKYFNSHDKVYETLQKFFDKYAFEDFSRQEPQEFPNEKPQYLPSEIGINEKYYNLLLNFFKTHKEIKQVWLHGSRVKGTYSETTDIDMVALIDNAEINYLKNALNYLSIPYRMDLASITLDTEFANYVSKTECKVIYRAEDFK